MSHGCFIRRLAGAGFILLITTPSMPAQSASSRLRGTPNQPPAVQPQPAPVPAQPTSLLQESAKPALVNLGGQSLLIRAENSSLSAILRDIASKSGMKIEGLGSDERVFGTFGPGKPRDVIEDLLNGTAYNLVLLGDLANGAPRELILTPATQGGAGAVAAPAPQANPDDSEPEAMDSPPQPPEAPPEQPSGTAPTPGVRTPQQLFEQLQRMRQNQGQQPPDPQ